MNHIDEITEEDAGCGEHQAELYLAEADDGEDYYFLSKHGLKPFQDQKKKSIATHKVPRYTNFAKIPRMDRLGADKMLDRLKRQLSFWEEKYDGKAASHLNNASNGASKEQRINNTKSGLRYKQRVKACKHFISKLEEHKREVEEDE